MDELLARVLESHGGLENWSKVRSLSAELLLDGPFWDWRGLPEIRQRQTMVMDTRREHLTLTPFTGDRLTAVFDVDPVRVRILGPDGEVVDEREDPLASFPTYDDTVAWDAVQLGYFTGTANWNYFVEPFLFTYPGVEAHEIEPWQEGDETWRRLAVTFPADLPNHNPEQTFYFDDDFVLRRMDYAPDVTGDTPIAHYVHDPKVYDGFLFYGRRLVHLRDADGRANQDFTVISVVTESVSVERDD